MGERNSSTISGECPRPYTPRGASPSGCGAGRASHPSHPRHRHRARRRVAPFRRALRLPPRRALLPRGRPSPGVGLPRPAAIRAVRRPAARAGPLSGGAAGAGGVRRRRCRRAGGPDRPRVRRRPVGTDPRCRHAGGRRGGHWRRSHPEHGDVQLSRLGRPGVARPTDSAHRQRSAMGGRRCRRRCRPARQRPRHLPDGIGRARRSA